MSKLIKELQSVTNVITTDVDYLLYLLLKDGSYFEDYRKERKEHEIKSNKQPASDIEIQTLESLYGGDSQ